jgi:hypothetical protein
MCEDRRRHKIGPSCASDKKCAVWTSDTELMSLGYMRNARDDYLNPWTACLAEEKLRPVHWSPRR